jgi:hypothetical protein
MRRRPSSSALSMTGRTLFDEKNAMEAELKKVKPQNSSMFHRANDDAARISQLERELEREKAKSMVNEDAQKQLKQLRQQ